MKWIRVALAFLMVLVIAQAEGTKVEIGAPAPEVISTYYAAKAQDVKSVESKLKANGFSILSITEPIKGSTVITVTNEELTNTNSWLATLNVLVNEKEVRIQNPSYFGAAYLQDKYTYGQFSATLRSFQKALGDLYTVADEFELAKLPEYRFSLAMPKVGDTIEVGKGEELESKLKKRKKYVAYSLKLPNGSTLVGHNLGNAINEFLLKIDAAHNAHILPYKSMIKDGKAVMLDPKYYLAVSLPLLSMLEFLKINYIPDSIETKIKKTYR